MEKPENKSHAYQQKGKPVTSYDVARHAGVSQSAVSRCFKPGASVSKKMRERVMEAANELGYEPNAIARSLITRRSNIVAVLISSLTNLYYPEVLAELTQRLSARGIRVLLFSLPSEADASETLTQIWPYRVDGVITAAELTSEQVAEFHRRHVPLVFYNRHISSTSGNAVCCDQEEGARQLVDGLVKAGHQHFGIIAGPADSIVSVERVSGALERLEEHGIEDVPVVRGDYSYESGFVGVDELFKHRANGIEAIICANDVMALGAIDGCRKTHNLIAPDDVSVVGFDGVGPANWRAYDLTTIRQPVRRMTAAAVSMMVDLIELPDVVDEKRVFSGIVRAGSSARFIQ